MYKNLAAEMVRHGISKTQISDVLGVRRATLSDKIRGKHPFKLNEAIKIKNQFFPNLSFEYLFQEQENKESEKRLN
ncbi:helix-turn-helix domain-containing protein [Clostridium tunisiense]|uniref:helix-turn-helix domain-containing protein n=1 Tax=Clostridium tunisiense TaxID=219748 RepID=UPI0002E599C6|nr:helix-turn-helix transcriptional regulator [Clostridium tunisiense]